jgi:HTH-type transcriptional regulator / antitoxin HigA
MTNKKESIISEACEHVPYETVRVSFSLLFDQKIETLGITKHQAYNVLGLDKKTIEPILDGTGKITDVFSLIKLGEFLDFENISELIKAYTANASTDKIEELSKIRKANYIVNHFNLEVLKKLGFLKSISINDFGEIENLIKENFGLDSIYDYDQKIGVAFKKSRRAKENKMLDFWVTSAHQQFLKINNPNAYDREYLKDLIPKIKPYTLDEEKGLLKVACALYYAGVTVIAHEHITTTQVHGATFIINDKPCIVLTDLNKKYSTVWFALMHELFHCLFDFEEIQKQTFHLTAKDEPELFLNREAEADKFAKNYLFSDEKLNYIRPLISNVLVVNRFANSNGIHPSIIYDFYCWDLQERYSKDHWKFYRKYIPSSDVALSQIRIGLFDYKELNNSIAEIKREFELLNR